MSEKIVQTAGRQQLGEFAPMFAHLNDDVLFGEVWNEEIPFCTSGSSGIGSSGKNLEENAGSGNWLEGARFGADVTSEELESWINGLQ
ncbi:Flavodoxin [Ruminococcaceae bacterium YAD3003]|nr:Flavodoxin [Ruminococcaceae bacterium YAD3003]